MPAASPVFSVFGDQASYALVPDGAFQANAAGWTLAGGTSVVPGGEPWNVSGSANPQSLSIPAGGSATSPPVCVSNLFPSWRFFAKSDAPNSTLQVWIQWTTPWGLSGWVPSTRLNSSDYSTWNPTSPLALGALLPPGATLTNRFVFTANGGTWNIDDVYVDPYAR